MIDFELIKYAYSAVSFVIDRLDNKILSNLDTVLLFGSVSIGSQTKESDIDIFFSFKASNKQHNKIKSIIKGVIENFYLSNEYLKFKLKGISNQINVLAGDLDKWQDLKKNIYSSCICLYGKYQIKENKKHLKPYVIFSWESNIRLKGSFLNSLYGYKIKKKYLGLIDKTISKKIGKSSALVPLAHKDKFIKIMEKYKINYSMIDVFSY